MAGKKAFVWVLFWFDLTLCFCIGILIFLGRTKALEFISGFVIEQSLSIDNLILIHCCILQLRNHTGESEESIKLRDRGSICAEAGIYCSGDSNY